MIIREPVSEDVAKIVELLKLSLGESLMPKSVEYWSWKHQLNPFGESPVLLAEENGQLIGVRAFMNWQWQLQGEPIKAVRAVDTATHPDFQGKGIFKKLTLGILEKCANNDVEFVFNTPNEKSKPGYLKMGWVQCGKMPINIWVKRPFNIISNIITSKNSKSIELSSNNFSAQETINNWKYTDKPYWTTLHSKEYLDWRYLQIPIIKYFGHYSSEACLIFRIKEGRLGNELRICDWGGNSQSIKNLLTEVYDQVQFDFASVSGLSKVQLPGITLPKSNLGPVVTIKTLSNLDPSFFVKFKSWSPTVGDMEVF